MSTRTIRLARKLDTKTQRFTDAICLLVGIVALKIDALARKVLIRSLRRGAAKLAAKSNRLDDTSVKLRDAAYTKDKESHEALAASLRVRQELLELTK